jgi:tRNA(fMet)-specific endonuclease VapC
VRYLIDTNICVYIIKNKYEKSSQWILNAGIENVFISSITVAELEFGIAKSSKFEDNQKALYKFLSGFEIVDFDMTAAKAYGHIRADLQKQGTPIGNMDMLIGAIAMAKDMTVVTNNVREFQRIRGLRIENWVTDRPA